LICSFLTNLPEPACLVAHNGNGQTCFLSFNSRFDFPILISELNNAKQPVPENILCVDSLKGFKGLDGPPKKPEFVNNKRKNRAKNNRKKSYSLPQLYKSIFGQDPTESHAAEGDCKTLLRVIQTNALSFCQWCDKNAEPL
ncbi:unnamed protein product, partial [Lymnaea stagnalis]